jgi:hypothetical protein
MMGLSVNPSPAPDSKAFEQFFDLLSAAKSPAETEARLAKLAEATQKLFAQQQMSINALDELRRSEAPLNARINAARAEHEAAIAKERKDWDSEQTQRLAQLQIWEKQAQDALAKAEQDRSAAAKLRADWEGRARKIQEIVAA